MKLCAFLILATATSVIADGHADICSTQFNYWYSVSNNLGPAGYPYETAEEKLRGLVKKARPGMPVPSMCEMQENANSYYHHWEDILRFEINGFAADTDVPGYGFPFASRYTGLVATCKKEDSKFLPTLAGGPAASCAFGYPGSKGNVTIAGGAIIPPSAFENVKSTCRLKILGFEDEDLELQWCITDILKTMRVDKEGGYYDGNYDGFDSTTPDLKCPIQTSFSDAGPILGTSGPSTFPLFEGAPYPNDGKEVPPVTWNCFDNLQSTTVQNTTKGCFDKFDDDKNTIAFEKCLNPGFSKQNNRPNDPYQQFSLLFREMADQKVAGMCNACEECRNAVRHDGVYPDPEEYCQRAGKCGGTPSPLPPMPPKKKSSKKK